jgi:hypothetical protein
MSELANVPSDGELPSDLASCWAVIAAQREMIEALTAEQDKLRALIQHMLNGHRSERRVLTDPNQGWLPFSGSIICRSIASRTCSPAAVGCLAARRS